MRLEAENISFQYDNGNRKILNNVSMGLEQEERVGITAPSGFGKTTFCKMEERIIRGLGIEPDWMNRYPGELSGGELQRFCIARALGGQTRFLLADEISTMLDLITQSQIWNFLLEEVKCRKMGLLVVSHSGELLERVCTRIVDLKEEISIWT